MNIKQFEILCKMSQKSLKKYLKKQLKKDADVVAGDGYIFRRGTLPICLVAHLDTVHEHLPKKIIHAGGKLASPQGIGGDDRAGVYIILELLKRHDVSIIFCEDEETGCIGARKFAKSELCATLAFDFLIELDRKGKNDAVFYDCDNDDFTTFILSTGYFNEQYGSFSDICELAPALGCAAVNLSAGYYNAHTSLEYVATDDVDRIIKEVSKIITAHDGTAYKWIEKQYEPYTAYSWKSYGGGWSDDTYEEETDEECNKLYYVMTGDIYEEIYARNIFEAGGRFLAMYPSATWNDIDIEYVGIDPYAL